MIFCTIRQNLQNLPGKCIIIPFDYSLPVLVVEHAYMVCLTTFVKILKEMGTSLNRAWGKAMGSRKTLKPI